jgi:hypothetical protein
MADSHYKKLGFSSATEANGDTLGKPFRVYLVALDELKMYPDTPATINPHQMLIDINRYMYPVGPDTAPHSFMVLEGDSTDTLFYPVSYGGANTVQLFSVARLAMATHLPALKIDSLKLVQIPALNIAFIAGDDAGGTLQLMTAYRSSMYLTSLGDTVKIDSGVVYDADTMFTALQQVALDRSLVSDPW